MNKIFFYIMGLMLVTTGCVDDYTDANPPQKLDAPTLRVSASGSGQKIETVPANAYQNNFVAYQTYGSAIEYTVSVIDAPGKVASVSVVPSVPDFGTVTLNDASVASLVGQEIGEFKFTFTPNPALPDVADRALNLDISVTDSQLEANGEPGPKTTTLTLATNLVKCISQGLEEGTYVVTEASGNLDGGVAFTLDDLLADGGVDAILVDIAMDRPGLYTIDEVTGGCWPVYYGGRANPELQVDLCGSTISGHEGSLTAGTEGGPLRTFTIDGTINSDGTVNITWSYERTDAGGVTPVDPAKGTYKIAKVE
jgi:hypothetical protein